MTLEYEDPEFAEFRNKRRKPKFNSGFLLLFAKINHPNTPLLDLWVNLENDDKPKYETEHSLEGIFDEWV